VYVGCQSRPLGDGRPVLSFTTFNTGLTNRYVSWREAFIQSRKQQQGRNLEDYMKRGKKIVAVAALALGVSGAAFSQEQRWENGQNHDGYIYQRDTRDRAQARNDGYRDNDDRDRARNNSYRDRDDSYRDRGDYRDRDDHYRGRDHRDRDHRDRDDRGRDRD
jgi:hypothetical protein